MNVKCTAATFPPPKQLEYCLCDVCLHFLFRRTPSKRGERFPRIQDGDVKCDVSCWH